MSHSYEYKIHSEINIMNESVESLFIEINVPNTKNIIIGVVYRPPSSNSNDFLVYLTDLLNSPLLVNKDVFIMGDFNINILMHNNNNMSHEFLEIFLTASFLPLISKPTRMVNHSATLIYNIFL